MWAHTRCFWLWQGLLEIAPKSTERLTKDLIDSLTLLEYKNIRRNMSSDSSTLTITDEAAESNYVICNAPILKMDFRS